MPEMDMLPGSPLSSENISARFTDEARYQSYAQSHRRSIRLQQVSVTMWGPWTSACRQSVRLTDGTALQRKTDLRSSISTAITTEVSAERTDGREAE